MEFDRQIFFDALASPAFAAGAALTIALAVTAQAAGSVVGLVVALLRGSTLAPVRSSARSLARESVPARTSACTWPEALSLAFGLAGIVTS